jgi:hypothetical protein
VAQSGIVEPLPHPRSAWSSRVVRGRLGTLWGLGRVPSGHLAHRPRSRHRDDGAGSIWSTFGIQAAAGPRVAFDTGLLAVGEPLAFGGLAQTCIFCGARGESFRPERWVPQWISRAVIGENQYVRVNEYSGKVSYSRIFDLTVPRVCPDCNHHWMSDMESRVRSIALPLIRGEPKKVLRPDEQSRLASWCFLKALTLEIGRPTEHVPTFPEFLYPAFTRTRLHRVQPAPCQLAGAKSAVTTHMSGSEARGRSVPSQNSVRRPGIARPSLSVTS